MADSSFIFYYFSRQRFLFKSFFFIPTTLALITTLFILCYISTTSRFFFTHHPQQTTRFVYQKHPPPHNVSKKTHLFLGLPKGGSVSVSQRSVSDQLGSSGNYMNEVFHDRDIFFEDYKQMNRSFRIYVYPHRRDDPFANVLLPVDFEPSGNYASESYFKKILMKSHFITKNPNKADLFFLPFSIARLRHDPRIGSQGIQDFIRHYIFNISQKYPYWNRTGGADHFYVACHSIGRSAMDKAWKVKFNAIQVVCSSSYFLSGYISHKDVSLPQIWPRQDDPPNLASSKRKKLAFFAGSINSPVREKLLQVWRNDTEIYAHFGRLSTPYADELLGSKFCLHVKGFEVNTARIADSLYYGCVPVIIANHYDLPFADILNWQSFSIIVATLDIPLLKKILKEISSDRYLLLHSNTMKLLFFFLSMGYSSFSPSYSGQKHSFKAILFIIPLSLALVCSLFILIYISKTSELLLINQIEYKHTRESLIRHLPISITKQTIPVALHNASKNLFDSLDIATLTEEEVPSLNLQLGLNGDFANDNEVYHDGDIFLEDYKEMNRSFKIYVYPHTHDDPFANILLPTDEEPTGNYASEHYFKNVLMKSHFITEDPSEADLFYMPFSIVNMRIDPRIDVSGIPYFVRDYVSNISRKYPYWNRTGGADHFYVCCHSIGKKAAEQAAFVKLNAIQVVCSANYFVSAYISHKDASMPQIWNRQQVDPQNLVSSKRKKLAFFAGRNNSPVRERVRQIWRNDTEIGAHFDWVSNIAEEQLGSKFCLHVKGYEVNTARASDALFYGCVPVIIANHYHLPFADVVNWKSFSVVLEDGDIPSLKNILKGISTEQYLMLQSNMLKVRKHFQWHTPPVDYDAFYTTMYQLWLRRSAVRISSVL